MISSKRLKKPKQYEEGWVEFYKLKFKVTPDVLIPRPETELLVDEILKFYTLNPTLYTLLDIGTGSGNIAISLAVNNKNLVIIASDISKKALKVAQQNAKLHAVTNIDFVETDLLTNITTEPDIIVTNLPYIPHNRIPYLDSSVKDFEPLVALDGGEDGFELYRKLFEQIKSKDWRPKLIIGEIDYTQGDIAYKEAKKYFPDARVEIKFDLTQKQRLLIIQNH